MSKITDQFEHDIVQSIRDSSTIPFNIPQWMEDIGVRPGARIIEVKRVGGSGSKTDVIIQLENSESIKISAKLSSADYFGNWYSHKRVIGEFGEEAFNRLTLDCTEWSNWWRDHPSASLYVGVSICFGKRSGNTAKEFTEVFTYEDILTVVAGFGSGLHVANCLYVSERSPQNINELFSNLESINEEVILRLSRNFKIIYRPINPLTEGTNRGKGIYTQFKPYNRLPQMTTVTTLSQLNQLGEYVKVSPNALNHNRLLKELKSDYNIYIPVKEEL